ncbi:MAG: DUF6365 family protein [Longimicrobiaceae bacterium]
MKVLLVTPVLAGSGETITALHLAETLAGRGHQVLFLSSPFARRFVEPRFPGRVRELGDDGADNRRRWDAALLELRPDAVVFADYALFAVPQGCAPLVDEPGWVESLDALDAALVTLDHFGFGQHSRPLELGPPHLGFFGYLRFSALPRRMQVLLPCPMHEPGPVPGRRGEPFRYWSELPLGIPDAPRAAVRRRYLEGGEGLLVFHSVPNWTWRLAEALELPLYRYLAEILELYLDGLPVTVVSVNNGGLLAPPPRARIRVVNLAPLPPAEYEALLFAADLVLTENRVSISMGKAVCGLQPCAVLRNGRRLLELAATLDGRLAEVVQEMERLRMGAVYPFEVFPNVTPGDLEEIGLYRGSSLPHAFRALELFGGGETRDALHALLTDPAERAALRARQRHYVDRLARLPDGAALLEGLVHGQRGAA